MCCVVEWNDGIRKDMCCVEEGNGEIRKDMCCVGEGNDGIRKDMCWSREQDGPIRRFRRNNLRERRIRDQGSGIMDQGSKERERRTAKAVVDFGG